MRVRARAFPAGTRQAFTPPFPRRMQRRALAASIMALALVQPARADDATQSGPPSEKVDLIEMSNARMAPDGALSAGITYFKDVQRYSLSFQALPWLQARLNYTGF